MVMRKNITIQEGKSFTTKIYDVIYADFPWQFTGGSSSHISKVHYTTQSMKWINNLILPAEDNCLLFLWTLSTGPALRAALDFIKLKGFQLQFITTWDKKGPTMGFMTMNHTELLLMAKKGKWKNNERKKKFPTLITEKKTKNSVKPKLVYDLIEGVAPGRNYCEIFARNINSEFQENHPKWDFYGNECF
jgi:N6-adenosine-specific RNA methylase IME4